jgi:hypothetical protein
MDHAAIVAHNKMALKPVNRQRLFEKLLLPIEIPHHVTILSQGVMRQYASLTIPRVDEEGFAVVQGQPRQHSDKEFGAAIGQEQTRRSTYYLFEAGEGYAVDVVSPNRRRTRILTRDIIDHVLAIIPTDGGVPFSQLKETLDNKFKQMFNGKLSSNASERIKDLRIIDSQHLSSILFVLKTKRRLKVIHHGGRKLYCRRTLKQGKLNGYL